MLFVQVFVVVIKKIASEIERVYRLHHHFAGCHAPELIAATKFKTTKIKFGGLFGLSTKINTHDNYPLYGNMTFVLLYHKILICKIVIYDQKSVIYLVYLCILQMCLMLILLLR